MMIELQSELLDVFRNSVINLIFLYNVTSAFCLGDVKRRLSTAILNFDVSDILGCDPTAGQIPKTDSRHCAHCDYSELDIIRT